MRRYIVGLFGLLLLVGLPSFAQAAEKTLHNAATANADGSNIGVTDKGMLGMTVTISGTATVTPQGSADQGTTYTAFPCTLVGSSTTSSSITATGQYICSVSGLSHFKAPLTNCSACTVTVKVNSSQAGGGVGGTTSGGAEATATAAAPTYVEGSDNNLSMDLAGNLRVTQGTLTSGEDQTNNLLMTSGGVVRMTTILGSGGAPTTATDATSAVFTLPTGDKTLQGIVTCTGTCIQTQTIYGTYTSVATVAASTVVCTLRNNATTTAQSSCSTDWNFPYWFVVTSSTAGTTPLAGLFAYY